MIKSPLSTDLIGEKTIKTDFKIEFFGQVDEVSAFIMDFYHNISDEYLKKELINIVKTLSNCMAETAGSKTKLTEQSVIELDALVSKYNDKTFAFKEFALPGKTPTGAKAHVVRTVVRRAERAYANVYKNYGGSNFIFEYLNKLSTLFFLIALFYDEV